MTYQMYAFRELDTDTLYELLENRFEVFVLGQKCIYHDFDEFDRHPLTRHLVARDEEGHVVGYVRVLPAALHYDGYSENSFGRLSVREKMRRQGIGGELVRRACRWLCENGGCATVRISAMADQEKFYSELGFVRQSDVFNKEGVPHVTMVYTAP